MINYKFPFSAGRFDPDNFKNCNVSEFDVHAREGVLLISIDDKADLDKFGKIPGIQKWGGPKNFLVDFEKAKAAGITEHPQHVLEQMGFEVKTWESEPGDKFAEIYAIGDDMELPEWLTVLN